MKEYAKTVLKNVVGIGIALIIVSGMYKLAEIWTINSKLALLSAIVLVVLAWWGIDKIRCLQVSPNATDKEVKEINTSELCLWSAFLSIAIIFLAFDKQWIIVAAGILIMAMVDWKRYRYIKNPAKWRADNA